MASYRSEPRLGRDLTVPGYQCPPCGRGHVPYPRSSRRRRQDGHRYLALDLRLVIGEEGRLGEQLGPENVALSRVGDDPVLQQAAIRYWDLLHDTIAACQPEGTPEAEVLRRAAVTWATVYGISRLSAFGQLPASVSASADELIHDAIDQLIAGWQQPGATHPQRK